MSVQQSAPDSRLPGEKRYVEAVLGDEYDLDRGLFMDAGDSIAFYTGEEEIAELTYDSAQEQSLREALVEAVAGDEAAAAEAREALTSYDERLGVRVETEPESVAGIDTQGLKAVSYEASEVSQDVMAHEHREGMCNHCGAEMDMVVAQPGEEDLDVYLYECDACGNEGHYFGGEETEDGAVTVWSEFTDRDSLTREVDVREGAKLTVYDLGDVPENPLEREPEQGRVYSMEAGNGWKTRPDGLLQRLLDRPVPMSQDVREVIERQMEDPNMGVLIEDPAGGSDVEDGDDHYVKVVDESQVEFQGIR